MERHDKLQDFFKVIFGEQIDPEGNFIGEQQLRLFQANDSFNRVDFFTNIDTVIEHCNSKTYGLNTYYNISLTNGISGQEQDLITRSVLAFDFDKKDFDADFSYKDLIDKFKELGLWYHALVDSGNGYHAYICIEPTVDHSRVVEVIQAIGGRLGADKHAMKSTQVLRVPYTFNVKDPLNKKQVRIIKQFEYDTIKRYDLDRLYNRFCTSERDTRGTEGRVSKHVIRNTNIPPCIVRTLSEGSTEGDRYEDLQRIVVTLRGRRKSLPEITATCKEWADKSGYTDNVEYRVEHIYDNLQYASMNCKDCKDWTECHDRQESEFNFTEDFTVLSVSEKHLSKLKPSKRKGAKVMEANDLLIYGILKNHSDGLFRDEIIKELTYKKKCRFSKNVITDALQSLEANGFIEVSGRPKFYKIKEVRSKADLTYNISFGAMYEAVKGNISTEELRLYAYMRYLHNKEQRENPEALKGNLFQFTQRELAKEMGVTQGRISQMIDNLLDELLLSIWYREPSKNTGFDYYVYRLNY